MNSSRSRLIRARIAAGIVGMLFVGVSVAGLATSASAGPIFAPTITAPVGPGADGTPMVTVEVPQEIFDIDGVVTVSNSLGTYEYCSVFGVDATSPGTSYQCDSGVPLPFGDNTFTATSYYTGGLPDANPGPVSAPVVYTHWDQTGHAEILAGPAASSVDPTASFSGTGPALGTVALFESAFFGDQICETEVLPDGTWQCDLAFPLNPGVYEVDIFAGGTFFFDGSGPVINDTPAPYQFEVLVPPAASVDQLFTPWVTSDRPVSVQGNKDAAADYIQVYYGPTAAGPWTPYCQTSGDITGATVWFCDEAFGMLQPGTNYLAALAFYPGTSADFGPSAIIERVAPPDITFPNNAFFTNDPTPTISGTSVYGDDATVYNTTLAEQMCSTPLVAGEFSCDAFPMADGLYTYFVFASPGDGVSSASRTITIDTVAPDAPTVASEQTTILTPTLTGTAEMNSTVSVFVDGSPASCENLPVIGNEGGEWECTLSEPLSLGFHDVMARQTDRAGNTSPDSELGIIEITIPDVPPPLAQTGPVPTPTPTPGPTALALLILNWTLGGVAGEYSPGDTVTLTGSGLPAGALADAEIHSTPQQLGTAVVDAAGTFEIAAVIPDDIEPGQHTFVVTVTAPGAETSVIEQPVMVVAPAEQKATIPKSDGEEKLFDTGGVGGGGGGTVDRNAPNAPSAMTTALDTVLDIIGNPVVIASAAAVGLGLLLFVAIPAELLNATLSEQYGRFSKRLPKLKRAPGWWAALTSMLTATPVVGAILITALVAIIFGFADPNFGFDLTSLRVVLACGIGLLFVGFIANALAGIVVAKRWAISTRMEIKPLGVILAVLGVVISRLLEFSPGLLIGLLLGIAIVGKASRRDEVRTTLTKAGILFGLSIVAWLVYSFTSGALADQSFGANLFLETLVAITTEGLTALAIGLLPFKFLEGESLWNYSKPLWVGVWVFVAAVFALVVVPNNFAEINGSLWVWGLVVAGFAVVAVGIYVYFRFFAPPIEEDQDEDESVAAREPVGSARQRGV